MINYKSHKAKKIINNILLFIFIIFSLSDLIEMHIRLIYKVDLSATHFFVVKSGGSTKVKPSKKKNTASLKSPNLQFSLPTQIVKTSCFRLEKKIIKLNYLVYKSQRHSSIIIPRGPPISIV